MKKSVFIIYTIVIFFLQSCASNLSEVDYIEKGKFYKQEYIDSHYMDKKSLKKAESNFLMAMDLNKDDFETIELLLDLYFRDKRYDDWIILIDSCKDIDNDIYDNYLRIAKYCMKTAQRTNERGIKINNENIDLRKLIPSYDTYDKIYEKMIIERALKDGDVEFGYKLYEKALNYLNQAYAIRKTSEVLILFSDIYKEYDPSKISFIASNSEYVAYGVRSNLQKAEEFLKLSFEIDDTWEAHYKLYRIRLYQETQGEYYVRPEKKDILSYIFEELDAAIELSPAIEKEKLLCEKGDIYLSTDQYDKASDIYLEALELGYNEESIQLKLSNVDIQKNNDLIYSKCASILGLSSGREYREWKYRCDSNTFKSYLLNGEKGYLFTKIDFFMMPKDLLQIIDVSYQNGLYIYLVTSTGRNKLSKYCKIISQNQLTYYGLYEYIIHEELFLKCVGKDVFKNQATIETCLVFQNMIKGTDDYEMHMEILSNLEILESQIR